MAVGWRKQYEAIIAAIYQPLAGQDIIELAALLDEAERREWQFPHRRRQLRLLHSLGRRLLSAHLEWIEEVEQELGPPAPP